MRYMLNQSKVKLVEKANERHQKIKDFDDAKGNELTNVKTKKGMDNVKEDFNGDKTVDHDFSGNADEFEEQYNANHDFAIF